MCDCTYGFVRQANPQRRHSRGYRKEGRKDKESVMGNNPPVCDKKFRKYATVITPVLDFTELGILTNG